MGDVIAMLLAGGEGKRLGAITRKLSKPAVHFGGSYRLIDFPLSNCTNSSITSAGVLIRHETRAPVLKKLLADGEKWGFSAGRRSGLFALPERFVGEYSGTADAVYKRLDFAEDFSPRQVLVLCTDHIYRMDYRKMLALHRSRKAELTVAVTQVPWSSASRFGIMVTNSEGRIIEFEEKPEQPSSNQASMGIYIFEASVLREYLHRDQRDSLSTHDFGKDIIPGMVRDGCGVYAYNFAGYWKDVGTPDDFWQANMDLVTGRFEIYDENWPLYSSDAFSPPEIVHAPERNISSALISEDVKLNTGIRIENSLLSAQVRLGKNTLVKNSVLLPGVYTGEGRSIEGALVYSPGAAGGSHRSESNLLQINGYQGMGDC